MTLQLYVCRDAEKESNPKALIDALKFYDGYKDHKQHHIVSDGKFISYAEEDDDSSNGTGRILYRFVSFMFAKFCIVIISWLLTHFAASRRASANIRITNYRTANLKTENR